mmetsp:Transcript_33912/g.75202  ORF Transcript_33912/g.75202 Transcript_33912/m.75202 type:complete len:94 (+) Transcript_33912:527-808(+)
MVHGWHAGIIRAGSGCFGGFGAAAVAQQRYGAAGAESNANASHPPMEGVLHGAPTARWLRHRTWTKHSLRSESDQQQRQQQEQQVLMLMDIGM